MRKRIFLILFFGLFAVYLIFFPHQLKKELVILPSWSADAFSEPSGRFSVEGAVPFKFDNKLGYFSSAGEILYSEDVMYNSAVSSDVFINYSSISNNLVLKDSSGRMKSSIETEGFPFFINSRLFVLSPDRMSVSEYGTDGSELLTISSDSLITSMDAGARAIIIGKLNGEVSVFTGSNKPDFTYFSTDSRYSVAYACALTDDGTRFAAVTGLYPQQLICFEYRNESWVPVFRKTMNEDFRRNILMDYSTDGRLLYVESRGGLLLYSTATFLENKIPVEGSLTRVLISGESDLSYILSADETGNIVRIYRPDTGNLADFHFPGGDFYFRPAGGCFYIGVDGKIIRYDIMEG